MLIRDIKNIIYLLMISDMEIDRISGVKKMGNEKNVGELEKVLGAMDLSMLKLRNAKPYEITRDGKKIAEMSAEDAKTLARILKSRSEQVNIDNENGTVEIYKSQMPDKSVIEFFSGTPPGYWKWLIAGYEKGKVDEARKLIKELRDTRERGKSLSESNPIIKKLNSL